VLRPVAAVKFRAGLDADGLPVAIEAVSATEGPTEALAGKQGENSTPPRLKGCRARPTPSPTSASRRSTSKARPCSVTGARWAIR
jgi:hypothetical protein